jgi:S-methyl-5-thioribose-1-phosphate isomerase
MDFAKSVAVKTAQAVSDGYAKAGEAIGKAGNRLLKDGCRVLTHCNAGWLALLDWGSALAPVYFATREKKKIFVYVDETRPRLQGARLTSWELLNEGVEHAIIPDNAAGHFMRMKRVDIVITGADRIARNGDSANKIGTYEKAVLAKENNIPFYIAAPLSTFDLKCKSGDDIVIEERPEEEVLFAEGTLDSGDAGRVRLAPAKARALNPAFDVTPAKYITGIITPRGVIKPHEVLSLETAHW